MISASGGKSTHRLQRQPIAPVPAPPFPMKTIRGIGMAAYLIYMVTLIPSVNAMNQRGEIAAVMLLVATRHG